MHRFINLLLLTAAALCVAPRLACGEEPSSESVTDALQGTWVLVSTEERGEAKKYSNRSMVFEKNEYRFFVKALLVRKAVVTVNVVAKPYTMDLFQQIGPTQGQVGKCIFKLEGDTLTIAQGIYGRDRPSEFDSKDAMCSSVTIWKRPKLKTEYRWMENFYIKEVTEEREIYASEDVNQQWFLHKKPIETTKEANEQLASELEKGGSKWQAVLVDGTYRESLIITKSTINRYAP